MGETHVGYAGNASERTVNVIEILALAEEPMRLSELAQRVGIPKSAVHRILTSLIDRGWVEQNQENDCYALTLRMALLGQRQLAALDINNLRQPILDRLAVRTKELVRLTAVQNDKLVWIGSARGRRSGLVYEADMTEEIVPFATANGKIWLANLPTSQAVKIALDAGLGKRRDGLRTITTVEELLPELEDTRRRGYGLAQEEAEQGVAAVAMVIRDEQSILGTMSVAAPINRLGPERIVAIVPDLRRAAEAMALAWHGRTQVDSEPVEKTSSARSSKLARKTS
ncbi:IclR family transcriptional regulator [Microvirga sp. 3-52]|nr:IclR family transcriptional regulator [Microvirga sp. 3-52]